MIIDLTKNSENTFELQTEAKQDFSVGMTPACFVDVDGVTYNVPDRFVTVRTDTYEPLGIVGDKYNIMQPNEVWEFIDAFREVSGAELDKSIVDGPRIGVSLKINQREYISGDPIDNNFLIYNTFDGSLPFCGKGLTNRLFCSNQINYQGAYWKIRHTTNMDRKIDLAKTMMNHFQDAQDKFDKKMLSLVAMSVKTFEAVSIFSDLLGEAKTDNAKSRKSNQTEVFKNILENGIGFDVPGLKGTGYWVLQAITEYANHHRSIRVSANKTAEDIKFQSIVWGSANNFMQKGFTSLLKKVG